MTEQDPRPLKSDGETPAELVRALNALGRDRDAARLARVAQSLGTRLGGSGAATSGLSGATGAKLGLLVLALGLGAWALLSNPLGRGDDAARSTARPASPAMGRLEHSARAAAPTAAPAPPTPLESGAAEGPAQHAAPPAAPPPQALGHAAAGAGSRRAPSRGTDGSRNAAPGQPARAQTAQASASASDALPTPPPEPPRSQPQPPHETVEQAKPSTAGAAPPSEVALLQRARKLAVSEPEAALRLLDQHAERFASGLLVPERELLAIEVLRHLGRDAEAEQRLRRFEARYPESIHRRRLERSPATDEAR